MEKKGLETQLTVFIFWGGGRNGMVISYLAVMYDESAFRASKNPRMSVLYGKVRSTQKGEWMPDFIL